MVEQKQPSMIQTCPRSHVRKVNADVDGMGDLEPIPVFNWENSLHSQKREEATVTPVGAPMVQPPPVEEIPSLPLSSEIYGERSDVGGVALVEDLFVPILEPQSMDAMVAPI
ncbi:MAG: hypothetical protein SGARI_006323 [Bacillariaceae sp.]